MNPYLKYHKAKNFIAGAKSNAEWQKNRSRTYVTWGSIVLVLLIFTGIAFFSLDGLWNVSPYLFLGVLLAVLLLAVLVCHWSDTYDKPTTALLDDAAASLVRFYDSRLYVVRWDNLSAPEMRQDEDLFREAVAHPNAPHVKVACIDHVTRLRVYAEYADVTCSITLPDQTVRKEHRLLIFNDTPDYDSIVRRLYNRLNNVS